MAETNTTSMTSMELQINEFAEILELDLSYLQSLKNRSPLQDLHDTILLLIMLDVYAETPIVIDNSEKSDIEIIGAEVMSVLEDTQ